jgi:hypothetical protein
MKLSPKHEAILLELEKRGYRSCDEVRHGVLKTSERTWAWRTMQKLVKENLVRRVLDSKGKLIGWSPRRKATLWVQKNTSSSRTGRGNIPKIRDSRRQDQEVRWLLDPVNFKNVILGLLIVHGFSPPHK